ncbi:MAG: RICIN domain-containing protein [Fibrobacteria bacterium]
MLKNGNILKKTGDTLKITNLSLPLLLAASGLMAQSGPNIDLNRNMIGEVEVLKYITQPNTIVDLEAYKDYVVWGAVNETCQDPDVTTTPSHPAGHSSTKIGSKIIPMSNITHCHGKVYPNDPGILPIGSTYFKWSTGELYPLKHSKSRFAFWNDHFLEHGIVVEKGKPVSVKLWLATGVPNLGGRGETGIGLRFFPGYFPGGTELQDPPSKTNSYFFYWENQTVITDHVYTVNFTPQFSGTIDIRTGGDYNHDASTFTGVHWFKAFTLQDGRSNGVVPVGTYSPNKFAQEYFIQMRNSGKVMQSTLDFYGVVSLNVTLQTLNPTNKHQMWTIRSSNLSGYSNIWTKGGALTSGPYEWAARSLTLPNLSDPWQQLQFVDQGNGYKKIKFSAKGPGGEDIFLTSYTSDEGSNINVYYNTDGQEVKLLPAKDPNSGSRYQVQNVNSGKCLTVAGGSNSSGANIAQQTCNALSNQTVTLTAPATDYYGLRFQNSNQVMNIEGTASGAWAAQRPYSATSFSQMFTLLDHSDGTFSFQFRHSGQCGDIDVGSTANGARAKQNPCTYANRQKFRFIKVP